MKNIEKHTAGEWKHEVWDYSKANPPRKELVITSQTHRIAVIDCDKDENNPYKIPKEGGEANARLIASAPELLYACEVALEYVESTNGSMSFTADKLRKAIAKAKGQ